jgi:outer membrane protein assembly factor BamE (lipoprotein component of BamABCDE complex)
MALGKVGKIRRVGLAAALFVAVAGCGGSDDSTAGGRCLSEAEICQFTDGVSTKQQVQAALGKPFASQTVSNGGVSLEQWVYVCMPDQQSVQQVQFIFDGNGVLMGHLAVSQGPNAPPAPTCL